MANIALVRVDDRLIHGQIVTGWLNKTKSKKVIVINDEVAKNSFRQNMFRMIISKSIALEVLSKEDAVKKFQENQFGKVGPVMIIIGSVMDAVELYENGFTYEKLQLGGTATSSAGKTMVDGATALSDEEGVKLEELAKAGVEIVFQQSTQHPLKTWNQVKGKLKL